MMNNSEVGMVNSETKNPTECLSAGVVGRWSNLATHHPVRRFGCRILEQKGTKETKMESRFKIGTSVSSFPSVQNQAQSSPIKPNQAISSPDAMQPQAPWGLWFGICGLILCLDAIQSQPPSCSRTAISPILLRQTASKPVKAFRNRYLGVAIPGATTIYCGLGVHMHNAW
jgi:hypothetical protein